MACTDLCWHQGSPYAGFTRGLVQPLLLSISALMLTGVRLQYRHEAALEEARRRGSVGRDTPDCVIQGGQG
jgi:hypothetical protein